PSAFPARAASPPCQKRLRHETANLGPSSEPHTATERQPLDAGQPRLLRARIWPTGFRAAEGLPIRRECPLALLRPAALQQVSQLPRAVQHREDFYPVTPATERPPLRARLL